MCRVSWVVSRVIITWHVPKVMHCADALPCYSSLALSASPIKATIFRHFNLVVKTCSRHYKVQECLFIYLL